MAETNRRLQDKLQVPSGKIDDKALRNLIRQLNAELANIKRSK